MQILLDLFRTYCNDRFQEQSPPTIKQIMIFVQTLTSWEMFSNTFMAIVCVLQLLLLHTKIS